MWKWFWGTEEKLAALEIRPVEEDNLIFFFFEKKVLSVGVLDDFPHIDSHEASAPEILGRTKDSWLSCLRAVCGIEA